jgi:hypothetical protein
MELAVKKLKLNIPELGLCHRNSCINGFVLRINNSRCAIYSGDGLEQQSFLRQLHPTQMRQI